MVNGEPSGGYHFTNTLGQLGHVGYYRIDEPTYDRVPLDSYVRNVNRRPGEESEDLDLVSQPDTDPELADWAEAPYHSYQKHPNDTRTKTNEKRIGYLP